MEKLRIAVAVPPMLPVPPTLYSGTERVVANLVEELCARGHEVTLFAAGDSTAECEIVPVVERSLWSTGYRGDVFSFIQLALAKVWADHRRFDLIHSHVETPGFLFARVCPVPVVTTLHGRLDVDGIPELLDEFTDIPLVAISASQRRFAPDNNWVATIHHGLDLARVAWQPSQGDYLAFVGRITPEKGIAEAIDLARRVGRTLKIAAKVYDLHEQEHFAEVVQPAIEEGVVEYVGEVDSGARDRLMAGALATVMMGAWPEPFGLVAVESMATGTPVIARRAGALTETVKHGVDGFLVDDIGEAVHAFSQVAQLDRATIRQRAIERFSRSRMVDEYEAVYQRLVEETHRPMPLMAGDGPTVGVVVRDLPAATTLAGGRNSPKP